jgi:DNA repair exonuclease SbcCD nuclease subunit
MDGAETPEGTIRIGLAHGGVQSFSEDGADDTLAPNRATTARLDYLALGDWHGPMQINGRTWYSGSPEADQFKHGDRGSAFSVLIPGPGQVPDVRPVETGQFLWASFPINCVPGIDPMQNIEELLPAEGERRDALMRFELKGRVQPEQRAALVTALNAAAPDFARLTWTERDLAVEFDVDDLDRIDQAGVLRAAAEVLYAQTTDEALSAEDRTIARGALNRLYGYAVEAS